MATELSKAMKNVKSPDQLQEYADKLAPMGQMGMKVFQGLGGTGLRSAARDGTASQQENTKARIQYFVIEQLRTAVASVSQH